MNVTEDFQVSFNLLVILMDNHMNIILLVSNIFSNHFYSIVFLGIV